MIYLLNILSINLLKKKVKTANNNFPEPILMSSSVMSDQQSNTKRYSSDLKNQKRVQLVIIILLSKSDIAWHQHLLFMDMFWE